MFAGNDKDFRQIPATLKCQNSAFRTLVIKRTASAVFLCKILSKFLKAIELFLILKAKYLFFIDFINKI
jgi:hypothetical protein